MKSLIKKFLVHLKFIILQSLCNFFNPIRGMSCYHFLYDIFPLVVIYHSFIFPLFGYNSQHQHLPDAHQLLLSLGYTQLSSVSSIVYILIYRQPQLGLSFSLCRASIKASSHTTPLALYSFYTTVVILSIVPRGIGLSQGVSPESFQAAMQAKD